MVLVFSLKTCVYLINWYYRKQIFPQKITKMTKNDQKNCWYGRVNLKFGTFLHLLVNWIGRHVVTHILLVDIPFFGVMTTPHKELQTIIWKIRLSTVQPQITYLSMCEMPNLFLTSMLTHILLAYSNSS